MPKLRLHRRAVIWAACVIVAGAGAVWAGQRAWAAFASSHSTPSCSWPLRIRGKPTPGQAGLIRCYVSALARRDTAALLAIAPTTPAVRITGADLAHSADARSGRATVTFLAALVDTDWVPVIITYADGATDRLGVQNMIEMGGPSVWRMTIGTDVNPGPPGGPAPAVLGVKVSGVFVMVGGPAPGVRLPLPGRIVATNTAGRGFTGIVGKSGRFTIWLPPGTYHLTGHSPRAHAGGHEMRCAAAHPVRAQAGGSPTPRVEVACSVP
jgi:hypothetical protein